jgi:hypothetical protein
MSIVFSFIYQTMQHECGKAFGGPMKETEAQQGDGKGLNTSSCNEPVVIEILRRDVKYAK